MASTTPNRRSSDLFEVVFVLLQQNAHQKLQEVLKAHRQNLCVDAIGNENGLNLLACAAQYGAEKCIQVLLEFGANVDFQNSNNRKTALHLAYQHKRAKTAATLIKCGAAESIRDAMGMVPRRTFSADDKLKRELFHWRVCEILGKERRFQKPTADSVKTPQIFPDSTNDAQNGTKRTSKKSINKNAQNGAKRTSKKSINKIAAYYRGRAEDRSRAAVKANVSDGSDFSDDDVDHDAKNNAVTSPNHGVASRKQHSHGGKRSRRNSRHGFSRSSSVSPSRFLSRRSNHFRQNSAEGRLEGYINSIYKAHGLESLEAKIMSPNIALDVIVADKALDMSLYPEVSPQEQLQRRMMRPSTVNSNHSNALLRSRCGSDNKPMTQPSYVNEPADRFQWLGRPNSSDGTQSSIMALGSLRRPRTQMGVSHTSAERYQQQALSHHSSKLDSYTPIGNNRSKQQLRLRPSSPAALVREVRAQISNISIGSPESNVNSLIQNNVSSGETYNLHHTKNESIIFSDKSSSTRSTIALGSANLPPVLTTGAPHHRHVNAHTGSNAVKRASDYFWSPHTSSMKSGGNVSSWFALFKQEQSMFASPNVFAEIKLGEALHMLHAGNFLPHALTSLLLFLLGNLEPLIAKSGSAALFSATYIALSIFEPPFQKSDDLYSHPTHKIIHDAVSAITTISNPLSLQFGNILSQLCKSNSAIETVLFLRQKHEIEKAQLPRLHAAIQRKKRVKNLERSIVDSIIERSYATMLRTILHRWSDLVKNRKRVLQLSKQLLLKQINVSLKGIFKRWKKTVEIVKYNRAQKSSLDIANAIKRTEALMNNTSRHNQELGNTIQQMQDQLHILNKQYEEKQEFLNSPCRRPSTFAHITTILCECLRDFCDFFQSVVKLQHGVLGDEDRPDRGSLVTFLGPNPAQQDPSKHYIWDAKQEKEMQLFIPGLVGAAESAPAFEPFKRRCGQRLLRWIEYQNKRVSKVDSTLCGQNGSMTKQEVHLFDRFPEHSSLPSAQSLADGKALTNLCSVLHDQACNTRMFNSFLPLEIIEDIEDNDNTNDGENDNGSKNQHHMAIANNESTITAANNVQSAAGRCKKLLSLTENTGLIPHGVFSFVTQNHLALLPPGKSLKQLKMEKKLASRLQNESSADVVVHMVSRYFGSRVKLPMNAGTQQLFAFVALLFTNHSCLQNDILALRRSLSEKKTEIHESLQATRETLQQFSRTSVPVDKEKEELCRIAAIFGTSLRNFLPLAQNHVQMTNAAWCDAQAFDAFLNQLSYAAWQSLCLVILSRRVREEVDIDDGTFTVLDEVKMQPIFAEMGIDAKEDPVSEKKNILTNITHVLKTNIRESKRIFGYYAASKPGDVGTMDKSEYWKFIKEIRIQADTARHRILSSRVDLIFQKYCILATKFRNDDKDSAEDELGPNDFIHVLVYLAYYIYPKKSVRALAKRLSVLIEQYVVPNACAADIDVFRDRFYLEDTQGVLEQFKFHIYGIFTFYAAADNSSDEAAVTLDTMNIKEFTAFANDAEIVGANKLSYIAVRTIFAYVQQDLDIADDSFADKAQQDSGVVEDEDNEMVLREFMEGLAAIAVWLDPNPLKTVGTRLRTVLKKIIIPSVLSKPYVESFLRKYKLPKRHAEK